MIDDFIQSELAYFEPMLQKQKTTTEKMRKAWKNETVRQRLERISMETYEMCSGEVKYGPFKGLKLDKDTWWGKCDLGSQCLGLYESQVLEQICGDNQQHYRRFIDIGAADGYYAIGMLVSGFTDSVICFETSEVGQSVIRKNWEKNGSIGQVEIFGEANIAAFTALPSEYFNESLVLIDIEGAEFSLLSLDVIQKLQKCSIVIEIHNWVEDFELKYTKLLKDLSTYFKIEVLRSLGSNASDINELRSYTDDNRLLLTSERRPCLMRFLKLTPLN